MLNGTYVFSPRSVFNYRLGATRRDGNQITAASGSVRLTELGFPPAISAVAQKETFPAVSFTGYASIGTPPDAPQTTDIYTIVAEQTLIRGRHTLTFGADLRLYNQNVFRPTDASGAYSFTRGFTQGPDPQRASLTAGDGWASFLTGYGSGDIQTTAAFAVRNAYLAGFFNDDLRWGRLTLNLGLRYDYEQPRTERYDRFSTFDFNRPFPITVPGMPQLRGVLTHPGRDGEPRGNFDAFYKGFGPRVGLAYRFASKTVLRSGYGIFYMPRSGYPTAAQYGAAGFQFATTWIASIDGVTPVNPLSNPYPNGLLQPPTSQAEILQLGQAIPINPRNNTGSSKYHSVQLRAQKRMAQGVQLLVTYTAGKLIDNGSGRVVSFTVLRPPAQNAYDLRAERSLSQQDVSQRLNISHTIDLPFGRGQSLFSNAPPLLLRIVSGWSVTGNAVFNTGFPIALTSSGTTGVFSAVTRPNNIGKSAKLSGDVESRLNRFFDTSVFRIPDPYTFGNTSRTLPDVRGPGRRSYNLALAKRTALIERVSLVFRAEAFNLTNTPFFLPPGLGLGSASFGVISDSSGQRQVQFSLRLLF